MRVARGGAGRARRLRQQYARFSPDRVPRAVNTMLIRKIEIVLLLGLAVTYRPALAEAANILDVALGKGGTFQGRLLDSDGQPVANRVVSVEQGKRAIAMERRWNTSWDGDQIAKWEEIQDVL